MDIDYSLDAVKIQKTGFFYQGERKVMYSEFKKISDEARHKTHWRNIVKDTRSWANKSAKKQYEFYLWQMARDNMEAVKFQSEARNAESLDQETLVGIISGPYTRNILEAVRTGAITRKTIRDVLFQDSLKKFDKNVVYRDVAHFHQLMMKKRQFGSKNLSASGTGDKETD
uniref:uncharacterized protein LOC105353434 n=1 Tax=Fragaria vesca subsp. vesca TaxID=101020 RepID=UPI0005C88EFA|nr:PREDICTED: uncharacterized protein LOC105353434 [Fragaria vesca subsp. vesca]